MPSRIISAATIGLNSEFVEVEVDVLSQGIHNFTIVGLPDTSIKESRDRVSSAIKNSGFKPPHQCGRITVNLAPADLPKISPIYDVPIALGVLCATNQLNFVSEKKLFLGELSLDGRIRSVQGVLPIAILAKEKGVSEIYVPKENAPEASIVGGVEVIPVENLCSLVKHLTNQELLPPHQENNSDYFSESEQHILDMSQIKGQEQAKRALEIAAAGGHNIILNGPPGSGKTLLAKTITTILPKLTLEESLEITKVFSVSGNLPKNTPLVKNRPFRSPHHSSSAVSLVGGGTYPRPGEISLAHRGVLFLDEFAEFPKNVLENLRQPLEDGIISISRAKGSLTFPAQFTLVAAMNPCPCGNSSDPERLCSCTPTQIIKYQRRISGPILDRIDLHIEVPRVKFEKIQSDQTGEDSPTIRKRVEKAREIQKDRFANTSTITNSEMNSQQIKSFCTLDNSSLEIMRNAIASLHLSARSYYRIIKTARTIADLEEETNIKPYHVAEAVQYRFRTE